MPIKVDRRPFLLAPERPPEGEPRPLRQGETETEMSAAWQERAAGAGVTMRRPQWSPNTMLVQEATLYAKSEGRDGEFHHRAAKAYWEDGLDLGDRTVILRIAGDCGLDEGELSDALDAGRFRREVMEEDAAAREMGVGGTPTYLVEGGEPTFGDLSAGDLRALIGKSANG